MRKPTVEDLFVGNSEIAALMRSQFASTTEDSSRLQTPLGSVETWSSHLKNAFGILLNSPYPMFLVWDCNSYQSKPDERILFYNDAYLSLLRETQQLIPFGRSLKDSWTTEDWSHIQADVEQVFTTGQALRRERESFPNHQNGNSGGHLYTWSYSAVWDETGQIKGVFATGYPLTVKERLQDGQEWQPSHLPPPTQRVESPLQQTQAALQESEARFQAFMSHSPTSAWIVDQAGLVLYLSPTYFQMFQLPQQDAIGKLIQDIYSKEFAEQFLENNRRVFQTKQVVKTIETAPRPDGSIGSFLVYKFPMTQASGEMLLGGIAIDITEHKQAEAERERLLLELAAERARFEAVLRQMPEGVIIADAASEEMILANQRISQIFQHSFELDLKLKDYHHQVPFHTYHPNGQVYAPDENPLVRSLRTGEIVSHEEMEIRYPDGHRMIIDANSSPIFDRQGRITSAVVMIQEITERKQAEIALRQSEERAQLAIKVGRLGTWHYNFDLDLVELDERMREIWGEPNAVKPIPLSRIMERIHPDDRERVSAAIGAALDPTSSGTYEIDYRIGWDDGTERWVSANGQVLFDGEGASRQPVSFFGTALDITDHKQAENVLRQSEEQFRRLANAMPQIVWTTNALGELDYVSQQWSDYTGLTLEQTQDQAQYVQVIHPDDVSQLYEQWSEAVASRSPYQVEIRIKRGSDGSYRWFLTRAVPIKTEQGQIIAWYGTSTDIDDRKQIETALVAQEQRYRYIFEAVGISIWEEDFSEVKAAIDQLKAAGVQDFDQYFIDHPEFVQQAIGMVRLRDVNPASLQLFGAQTKAELLNSLHQIFLPETRDAFIKELLALATGEPHFAAETVLQTLQGEPLQVWFSISFPPPSEAYDRVLVSLLNITDRKQAEAEREQLLAREQSANETLERFIEHTPVAVVMLDRDMRYLFASQRWMREYASGYTSLKGLSHYEVMTDIPDRWRQVHQRCLAGATERCQEDYYLRSDGSAFWMHWEVLPWYASDGEIGGIIIFAENITERKQAAQEREKLLEREQKARREAEHANRIKDEFLAVLSHELRSPLNPILGWAKLLQTRQFDESATKRALETIERNARLQTQLIDDLLDVSRILRGKMVLDICPVNVVTVIDAALETVRLSAEAKGIEIQKVVAGNIGLILGDAARLQQVIWNLLTNAVKFTPAGGTVEIRLEQTNTHIQIQVKDTGKGISAEFLPHVFEYFRQEDGTTTRKFGGLGLGLAIVRYLTEQHGGTVKAESPGEGLGATFTVLLPLSSHENERNLSKIESSSSVSKMLPLAELQILVVDDEVDMRELIVTILEQAGAQIEVTTSAIEALKALDIFKPDLIISDIGMPEMDGYELLRQIRSRSPEQSGAIPAIALTAYAGEINQKQALAAGFQSHIAKPVEPDELVKAIVTLMKTR